MLLSASRNQLFVSVIRQHFSSTKGAAEKLPKMAGKA